MENLRQNPSSVLFWLSDELSEIIFQCQDRPESLLKVVVKFRQKVVENGQKWPISNFSYLPIDFVTENTPKTKKLEKSKKFGPKYILLLLNKNISKNTFRRGFF